MDLIQPAEEMPPKLLIVTFVTRPDLYQAMQSSFRSAGFTEPAVLFQCIDNTGSTQSHPAEVIPGVVASSRADWVMFVHQDVLCSRGETFDTLSARLSEIEQLDPNWAVAADVGVDSDLRWHAHYTDSSVQDLRLGVLPSRVCSVDEHMFLVRRAAGAEISPGLRGFHLYGTDLCLHALKRGHSCWAIDYHLEHLGGALQHADMLLHMQRFAELWNEAVDARFLRTTSAAVLLSRSRLVRTLLGHPRIALLMMQRPRIYHLLRSILSFLRVNRAHWLDLGRN